MAEKPMIHGIVERYKRDIGLHEKAIVDLNIKKERDIKTLYADRKITVRHLGENIKVTSTGYCENNQLRCLDSSEDLIFWAYPGDIISDSWGDE